MFENEVKISFQANAKSMEDKANGDILAQYIRDCQGWAGGNGLAKPVAPNAIKIKVEFEPKFSLEVIDLGKPISNIKPESFLPTFVTDQQAIGGRIGGPILNQPGRFYLASNAKAMHGDEETINGVKYVFAAPFFGLGGSWVKQ